MRVKLKHKRFQNHNNERSHKAKNTITYYSNIAITTIITLIAFVVLIITLTSSTSSSDDVSNNVKEEYQERKDQPAASSKTTFNDNDIENVISATPNKNNSSAFTNTALLSTLSQQNARGHWDNNRRQSVSVAVGVELKGDDGHNGFYDKINTSNQRNEFNRFSTPTKSASEKFFENIELQESLSSSTLTLGYHRQLLPHRNKRYLVFPKGSSFQMIFDLIIGIVDYTSYAILGITCAVAWELPDKPPSELIEDVQLRLNEGTLGLRRNDSTQAQLKYVDKAIAASEGKTAQQLDGEHKAKMSAATFADAAEQRKLIVTTPYYNSNNNNIWTTTLNKPSVAFNRPLPAYNGYQPYNNNNNHNYYKNYYYAGDGNGNENGNGNDITRSSSDDKSDDSKTFQLQSGTAAANGYAPTHLNTHVADYYYNNKNNDMGTYNGVKSTSGSMNIVGGYDRKKYADWNRKGSWYNDSKYNKYAARNRRKHWWAQNGDRMQNAWQQRQRQWSKYEQSPQRRLNAPITSYSAPIYPFVAGPAPRTGRARQILQQPPKHHIYPVFGKKRRRRSNDMTDFEHKMDSAHLKAHLKSRQLLYGKIEKLYKMRNGPNGTECVLRAICETAVRQLQQQQSEPQSFISELLRVIFSLPQDMQQRHVEAREIAGHFRDAHAMATDCEFRYPLCGHSIWSDFKFGMKM